MSGKTILVAAPAVLGIPVLFWVVLAARGERESAPASAVKTASRPRKADSAAVAAEESLAPIPKREVRPIASALSPETAAIQERVRRMEDRLHELEAKRDELANENKGLEKQVSEKWSEMSARMMAGWRVGSWEKSLGLTDTQKQSLVDLLTKWGMEDLARPASRDAWLAREADLRPQLTADQAAKLHDNSSAQAQQQWKNAAVTIGSMIGASKDDQQRLQQSLGDLSLGPTMLLPEAYGADPNGLTRDAASRLRPFLTPDQSARLDKLGYK